jgi:AGZA family xanthine/uracil permease-like MFS transporter
VASGYPLFVRRDLDGFFGLFIDNLVQLLLIVALCAGLCGMTGDSARFIYACVLPGAAVSILLGNLFYAWQAHRVARREGRDDVTALPYGINTPSLLVYVFFVMAPVYQKFADADPGLAAEMAWRMGLVACIGSGVIEFLGAFVAEKIRRHTPRAALLSTLAGIAIGFISMTFALQIWQRPLVAMLPLAIILLTYFAQVRFPWGLPGGLVAILLGTAMAWILPESWTAISMSGEKVAETWAQRGFNGPQWFGGEVWETLAEPGEWLGFLSVIIPMGLFNVIGSLQNIESAEASGDRFDTRSALAANGIGTIVAALFGSCFPTTIYIGHPGWKGLGARAGYSTLNGVVITAICFTGAVALIDELIPIEAGIPIVLWIGIIITAQAYQTTPKSHAPAVAVGLFPAIAAWGATVMMGAFFAAQMIPLPGAEEGSIPPVVPIGPSTTMQELLDMPGAGENTVVSGFLMHGLNIMERGYIFTCMVMAAVSACLIDRKFFQAAVWSVIGAILAAAGLTHSYQLIGNQIDYLLIFTQPDPTAFSYRAYPIAVGYILFAVAFWLAGRWSDGVTRPGDSSPYELSESSTAE